MTAGSANASKDMGITSVVLQDDLVPRLSQHNVERLRAEIFACNWTALAKEDFEGTALGMVAKSVGASAFDAATHLAALVKGRQRPQTAEWDAQKSDSQKSQDKL